VGQAAAGRGGGGRGSAELLCSRSLSRLEEEEKRKITQPVPWQFSVLCDLVGGQNGVEKCC
jgi:hypothetical protein